MGVNASKRSTKKSKRDPQAEQLDSPDIPSGNKDRSMPLFVRKQSDGARKKLQHQLYLAQESPEATIDLSGCETHEVPPTVYSMCKVLQKEALLLHTNWLNSLKGGGNILDLITIRVLDLHNNDVVVLPDEICHLSNLQVLNVENNKLRKLPEELGSLVSLQTLNVKKNRLKDVPTSICKLKSLRLLDVSENTVTRLPKELCHVRTLETLLLDSHEMRFPNSEVCSQGTESIMTRLCSECGIDYIPPSNFLLEILEPPKVISPSMSSNALKAAAEDVKLTTSFEQYASQQEKKRQERIEVQREFENHQLQQAQLAAMSAADKRNLIEELAADELKVFEELNFLTQRKEEERLQLVASIQEVETRAADLMNLLLQMNEKARKTDEMLDKMEKERIEQEEWFVVRQEESDNLRKQDVLVAMEQMLTENENFDQLWKLYESARKGYTQRAMETESETNEQITSVLQLKRSEQLALYDVLVKQEKLQKEAFEVLQLQKDTKHARLTGEIGLIQEELAQLSKVEMGRRDERQQSGKNVLSEKRKALTMMMVQLLNEREKREGELKKRMIEMEQRREDGQVDYWMVQYQRLMDRKPQVLIDQERGLEIVVIKILEQSGAGDYISLFARHRITIETMLQMVEDDLKQMGVHELGLRKAIIRKIEEHKIKGESKTGVYTKPEYVRQLSNPASRSATAPSAAEIDQPVKDVTARGINSECCICMEKKSSVIFLNCGHVCACENCSLSVKECPLCRSVIEQRINLINSI